MHIVEIKRDVVTIADKAVGAALQADTVHLVTVTETRLGDALALLKLVGEFHKFGQQVRVHLGDVGGHHPTQQQSAVARGRVNGQVATPEGYPSGWGNGARVENLEFGEDHVATVPVRQCQPPIEVTVPVAQRGTLGSDVGPQLVAQGHGGPFHVVVGGFNRCQQHCETGS